MKKSNLYELLFLFSYAIALLSYMCESVNVISRYRNHILYISYIILIFIYIIQSKKYRIMDLVKIVSVIIISIISWFVSKNATFMILFAFIFAEKNIEFKKIVKFDFKLKLFYLLIVVFLFCLGFTDNYSVYRDGMLRNSMGFSHPNKFGAYIFSLYTEFMYLYFNKDRKILNITVTLVSTVVISYFCDSRSSAICVLILYLMLVLLKKNDYKLLGNKIIKKILIYSFVAFSLISIILGYIYNSNIEILRSLNSAFSGRLSYTHIFLDEYNINLFGNELYLVSNRMAIEQGIQALILDNSYVRILLQYGLLSFVMFAYLYVSSMKNSIKQKEYIICIILYVYLIRGLADNIMFTFNTNIFLLYFSSVIFFRERREYLYDKKNCKKIEN